MAESLLSKPGPKSPGSTAEEIFLESRTARVSPLQRDPDACPGGVHWLITGELRWYRERSLFRPLGRKGVVF